MIITSFLAYNLNVMAQEYHYTNAQRAILESDDNMFVGLIFSY